MLLSRPDLVAARLREALDSRRWRPRPPREVRVPKPRGGWRRISTYEPEEQAVHCALHAYLSGWFERRFLPSSWGFRPGRSVEQAARRAARMIEAGRSLAADLDVGDFFGTVPHDLLFEQLHRHGVGDPDLVEILAWIAHAGTRYRLGGPRGLAQGSALSPLLANVHLHPVDEAMRDSEGYQRYADDILCLERSRPAALLSWERLAEQIALRGLSPSAAKSGVGRVEPGWRYLGWTVDSSGRLAPPARVNARGVAGGRGSPSR